MGHHHLTLGDITGAPAVALLAFGSGDEGALVNAVKPAGYRGLIVEGVGGGHVPAAAVPELQQLAEDIPVILAPPNRRRRGPQTHVLFRRSPR